MTKLFKKILLVIFFVAVLVAVAGVIKFNILQGDLSTQQSDDAMEVADDLDEYLLTTTEGITATLAYTSNSKDTATLHINGESYELNQVESASGAKYANLDESVIYWEHQGQATIEIADQPTYTVPTLEKVDMLTFSIDSYTQDCVGVGPMKCLVVNGELFYDSIQGFEFEEGTAYELAVARTQRENVPADASIYEYHLVEVLTLHKQADLIHNHDHNEDLDGQDDTAIVIEADDEVVALDTDSLDVTGMKWSWVETQYVNDDIVVPAKGSDFIARFSAEGQFSSSTDCNAIGGSYELDGSNLSFGPMFATRMACANETLETEYTNMLNEVVSYMIDVHGNLVLMLRYDTGSMIFTPAV